MDSRCSQSGAGDSDQFSVFGKAEASGFKLSGENKSCCDIFL